MSIQPASRVHGAGDPIIVDAYKRLVYAVDHGAREVITRDRAARYRFNTHYHPYVSELVRKLLRGSVRGLLDADTEYGTDALRGPDGTVKLWRDGTEKKRDKLYRAPFEAQYGPTERVSEPRPVEDLDFNTDGAYAVYNWELFFHVPFTIAVHLSRNQRYAEAQRWFHFIFDPTDDSDGPTPERFWKVKPFRDADVKMIEEVMVNLATGVDRALQQRTLKNLRAWRDAPFRPHLIARARPVSYMLTTVMAYLDNLIDWGDNLFRQDTGEAIDEAQMLYVLAAQILGPKPQPVPKKGDVRPATYNSLKRAGIDAFGNALVDLETDVPFNIIPAPQGRSSGEDSRFQSVYGVGKTLYFCIPPNDKLLGYWDTVADRLFKIRNSLNLQGVFRQLALFEPPIDPGLLARAVAAGVDVSAAVAGLNQPLPLVRFSLLVLKASEICQEVKSLGANLLAAMEKEDNEALAVLRAKHEGVILGLAEAVKYGQYQEALKAREGVEKTLANATQRYAYYERLLGRQASEIKLPEMEALDTDGLLHEKLKASEPTLSPRDIDIQIGGSFRDGGHKISPEEGHEIDLMEAAQIANDVSALLEATGAVLSMMPDFNGHATPLGVGAAVKWGGTNLGHLFRGLSSVSRGVAARIGHEANRAGKMAGYARREQEWAFQSNLAAGEITQIYKQLRAAQIREAVAKREWENHQQQMRHAEEVEHFLNGEKAADGSRKTTTKDLYAWMRREVRGLYTQCFRFAFDVARKAERALQRELGDKSLTYLRYDYPSGREGLLAGERLHLDIKRMEMAYHDLNRREYEITQHVSLLQLDPVALMGLRATGRCTLTVPEALYDLHCPGHYFRRIKSVAMSIPGVTGPHVGVHCTLTLLKSTVRTTPARPGESEYVRAGAEDDRFEDHFGSSESIVTSSAQADSGLFETNLRDERYLPFEGAGAESLWQIELPNGVKTFDHAGVADVVLHIRYTAREGGAQLRTGATASVVALMESGEGVGNVRLLSVRHEFPVEWAQFKSAQAASTLSVPLRPEHYPYWAEVSGISLVDVKYNSGGSWTTVSTLPSPTGTLSIPNLNNNIRDLWVLVTWKRNA